MRFVTFFDAKIENIVGFGLIWLDYLEYINKTMYKETYFNTNNGKNARFLDAVIYLMKFNFVKNQKELAEKIGISENSLSAIKKGKKVVSDKTILKMLNAFPYIFNGDYFFGKDIEMNTPRRSQQQTQAAEPIPIYKTEHIPQWADTFIDLLTQQVKQNEALNAQLRKSIAEVQTLRSELQQLIIQLKK